jgi:hypothetical protein
MLIFGERHLRLVMAEYAQHYNGRRPHRNRELRPHRPDHPVADVSQKRIRRWPVLGGLLNEYERAAWKPRSRPVAELWNPTGSSARSTTTKHHDQLDNDHPHNAAGRAFRRCRLATSGCVPFSHRGSWADLHLDQ